jgi:hypothetical protein
MYREGVAEEFLKFLQDVHILTKLLSYVNYTTAAADVTGGKPIAESSQNVSG